MTSPLDKPSIVVLWLIPIGPACDVFQSIIKRLAGEHDAPVFAPHLTLGRGSVEQMERVSPNPIELRVLGIACSERFTKTLFVRFELTPELAEFRNSLGMEAAGFAPHLSLLYKQMPMPEKKQLASSISLQLATAKFGAIEAVRCARETAWRVDVESWETIASKPLAQS